jgi:hypothetical protein
LWRYSPLAALPPTEISGGVLKNAHRVLHQNFCKSSKNLTRGLRFPYGFLIIFLGSKPQENKKKTRRQLATQSGKLLKTTNEATTQPQTMKRLGAASAPKKNRGKSPLRWPARWVDLPALS